MSHFQPTWLLTDLFVWLLFFAAVVWLFVTRHHQQSIQFRRHIARSKLATVAGVVLCCYVGVTLLDSVHVFVTRPNQPRQMVSLLDLSLGGMAYHQEQTYSAPFAAQSFSQSMITTADGKTHRGYAHLQYAAQHLPSGGRRQDILQRLLHGMGLGLGSFLVMALLWCYYRSRQQAVSFLEVVKQIVSGRSTTAMTALLTCAVVLMGVGAAMALASNYHVMGTDKVGQDVFYQTLKSIRTGLLIGTLTTLFMLPFALLLGVMAGYFGGWVDDVIQYVYTTLSAIPGVLLISASILVLQLYIQNHPDLFPTMMQRADARLLALCLILGLTSWASLCRLLRAETLKLREMDYVSAAKTLGSRSGTILRRHILPNVFHIVLITIVLDFSGLVLAEAVLSYVGVGVDPTTMSWGNMINSARLELAREPLVWWPLMASLTLMFALVLSANVFADAVRDALDPRLREME